MYHGLAGSSRGAPFHLSLSPTQLPTAGIIASDDRGAEGSRNNAPRRFKLYIYIMCYPKFC